MRAGKLKLNDRNDSLIKASLTVAKIVIPGSNEVVTKAKFSNLIDSLVKNLSPISQGLSVVERKAVEPLDS